MHDDENVNGAVIGLEVTLDNMCVKNCSECGCDFMEQNNVINSKGGNFSYNQLHSVALFVLKNLESQLLSACLPTKWNCLDKPGIKALLFQRNKNCLVVISPNAISPWQSRPSELFCGIKIKVYLTLRKQAPSAVPMVWKINTVSHLKSRLPEQFLWYEE